MFGLILLRKKFGSNFGANFGGNFGYHFRSHFGSPFGRRHFGSNFGSKFGSDFGSGARGSATNVSRTAPCGPTIPAASAANFDGSCRVPRSPRKHMDL